MNEPAQQELPYTPPRLKRVVCGSKSFRNYRGKTTEKKCDTMVTVYQSVDPNMLAGTCSTCKTIKAVQK